MKLLKNNTVLAISSVLAMGISSVAAAGDVKIGGWLFQTVVDRDSAEDLDVGGLLNSGEAIWFDATQDIGNGLSAGVNIRFSVFGPEFLPAASVTSTGAAYDAPEMDQSSVRISGDFGTIDLGRNRTASSFLDSYDGTPTYWVDPMGWYNTLSATRFASFARFGPGSSIREERIMYTSPNLSGFTILADMGDGGSSEIGFSYSANGVIVSGFTRDDADLAGPGTDAEEHTGFLVAYNSPLGFFASAVVSEQDESELTGFKIGYQTGKHAVSYSAHTTEAGGSSDDYERTNITYVNSVTGTFQVFAQVGSEELGSADDDAVAFGAGIFF